MSASGINETIDASTGPKDEPTVLSLDEQEAKLVKILEDINTPTYSHVDTQALAAVARQELAAIRTLRTYRTAHAGEDVERLAFSDAKESDYERLGITFKTLVYDSSLAEKINREFAQQDVKHKIARSWEKRMFATPAEFPALQIMRTANGGCDALTRQIFFLLQMLLTEDLDLEPLVLWDPMRTHVDSIEPLIIKNTSAVSAHVCARTTLLYGTGQMDSVLFCQPSGVEFRKGSQQDKEGLFALDPRTVETILGHPAYGNLFKDEFFMLFSENRHPIRERIPNAITTSLAILQKTGKTKVALCLTTGMEWIFGVLYTEPEKTCYLTDVIKVDEVTDLDNIFLTTVYWVMSPPQKILKLFV